MKNKVMMAVDAGGTKTEVAIYLLDGDKLLSKIYGVGSYAVDPKALDNIYGGIYEVYQLVRSEYVVCHLQLALSGLAAIPDLSNFTKQLQSIFIEPITINVVDDGIAALYSVITDFENPSIVISAGTGLIIYGYANKQAIMAAGWGHLLGERGSSFSTIHLLVLEIIKNYEENRPLNELESAFLKMCECDSVYDLKRWFYSQNKGQIASFVKEIIKIAGDSKTPKKMRKQAIGLLENQGVLLALQIYNLTKRCPALSGGVLGFRGGFFKKNPYPIDKLKQVLAKKGLIFTYEDIEHEPIDGCYYYAKRQGLLDA